LRSLVFVNFYLAVLIGIVSFFLILFFTLISRKKWGIIFCVFVLAFSLGILRFHSNDTPPPLVFESQVNHKIFFSGIIVDEPDIRENNQKFTIETELLGKKTKILFTTDFEGSFRYGDLIDFSGKLGKPKNFETDQDKIFDYVNYLRKDGIFYTINFGDAKIVSGGHGNKIKRALFAVKNKFLEKINSAVRSPESLLLGGLILGERAAFSEEMRQGFINTGTIHIVALSGYNVTIVAEWIMKVFSFLPLNWAFAAGVFLPLNWAFAAGYMGIFLFVVMAGGQSTAVRAGTMAVLALIARSTGRNYDVGRALILVGVIMIAWNPLVLVHDVSFQLSFFATVAVIFFAPRIEKYFLWVPKIGKLRDITSVTFAVYIFVLPFILYKMGNLSLVALPANLLVLPFIPMTMLFGFLTGVLGIIHYFLAVPTGFLSYLILHYELGIVDFLANVPFASLIIPDFPLIFVFVIYIYFIYKLFGMAIKNFFILYNIH